MINLGIRIQCNIGCVPLEKKTVPKELIQGIKQGQILYRDNSSGHQYVASEAQSNVTLDADVQDNHVGSAHERSSRFVKQSQIISTDDQRM